MGATWHGIAEYVLEKRANDLMDLIYTQSGIYCGLARMTSLTYYRVGGSSISNDLPETMPPSHENRFQNIASGPCNETSKIKQREGSFASIY